MNDVDASARLRAAAERLEAQFIGKAETVRLLIVAMIAREHVLLVGPPGTAKSALLRSLAQLIDARYFEYLLTRFTEPSEIFGPVDIAAFRSGSYRRSTAGMLPDAEVVFLDEVFKSNSAILNSLLGLLNERRFTSGGEVLQCPLISAFGASNEVPSDESLGALYDRFLLRVQSHNVDAYQFGQLLEVGIDHEVRNLRGQRALPVLGVADLTRLTERMAGSMSFSPDFLATYKGLVFQIRAEGVSLSDRRVVKLLKLFAASAVLDGRDSPDRADLYLLKHVWNSEDQAQVLASLIDPVLENFYREQPERRRVGAAGVGLVAISAEIERIRHILTGPTPPSDLQLFSQLKALGELRTLLSGHTDPKAKALEQRVTQLLEASLKSGRFAQL